MKITLSSTSILILLLSVFSFNSCSEDAVLESDPFVVAFKSLSKNLLNIKNQEDIVLVYSETALETGTVTIQINETNAIYGTDYTTIPKASEGVITLPINSGKNANSIVFNKLNPDLNETTIIKFSIINIDYNYSNIQGYSDFKLNASASLGGSLEPEVGGPNQGNQVFIDLSSDTATSVQRDSWDLGFYSGDDFRVTLNGSIYMATTELDFTNIDEVTENDVKNIFSEIIIGKGGSDIYVNDPSGNLDNSPFSDISENDTENKVYLVNLGYQVGTATPITGSVAIAGNHRGWKKIRILKNDTDYILQYADIDATTHQEVTIPKDSNYNFSFFSFNTNKIVDVEPEKERWDISFTVFTQVLDFGGGDLGAYGFSDFVVSNRQGGTEAYMVETSTSSFDDFTINQVENNLFLKDQTTIGSNWRIVFDGGSIKTDNFFILKDPNGNIYKIKFLALTNDNNERGYPEFEYELLHNK